MVVRFISSLILSLILRVESNVLNMFLQSCVILLSWPQSWEDSHVFDIMVEGHHTQSIVVVRLPLIRYTFLFSSIPLIIFASLRSSRSLCLLVVSHIRGHISGSSPPLPTTVRALHFYRENISALSSLVDICTYHGTKLFNFGVYRLLGFISFAWFYLAVCTELDLVGGRERRHVCRMTAFSCNEFDLSRLRAAQLIRRN